MINKFYYSWENFQNDILSINSKIYSDSWMPDCVVGIKRGGLIPAVSFSHLFNIPMYTITYQLRDGSGLLNLSEISDLKIDTKILIVDDICDTGETFEKIQDKINFSNLKFCSLFYNIRQKFDVNYFARKIDRDKEVDWIVFPWEF